MERLDVVIHSLCPEELVRLEETFPSRFHRRFMGLQVSRGAVYLIAWLADEAVGHLLLWPRVAEDVSLVERTGPMPYIEALAVRADLRSRGIGTQLMAVAEGILRDQHADGVGLAVGVDNAAARRLYERLGYSDAGIGEFDVSWSYTDDDQREQWESERCVYLTKCVT